MVGNLRHEAVDRLLSDERAGRVVRVGEEEDARARRDRREHGVEVGGEAGIGHLDRVGPEELGHELVDCKRVAGHDDLVAGAEEGVTDELDDLVGAVAQDDVFPLEPGTQALGNRAAEFVTAAVGVEVGTLQSAAHRLQRLRGRPQRVLIGSEFDDLLLPQAEVAG